MQNKIRVRFAPSPTGYLHLGSARTAIFNWLYARHGGGKLILRIEDTDKERSKKEFLDEILKDLKWLGLDWDEGPIFQSERDSLYKDYADRLVKKGAAYKEGAATIFKVERGKTIKIKDMIHGDIVFNTDDIKDQVLIKSDGTPAYNFACVVDDHELDITHVIRGDDHISNTPKQILFYEALGLRVPHFAHMPLMMGKDGSKLSKRHGGVSVAEYKNDGFLPEALSNYLILLGWSPGENKEIVTLREAAKLFEIKDIGNVQARFDVDKLRWVNAEYIKKKETKELASLIKDMGGFEDIIDPTYFEKVVELYKTRFRALSEFRELTICFFTDDFPIDEAAQKKIDKHLKDEQTKKAFLSFKIELEKLKSFTHKNIEKACRTAADRHSVKPAGIIHPTRAALSGKTAGCGLFEMMELLGKEKVIERLGRLK